MKTYKQIWITDIAIFIFLFIYLSQITPLVPFDADDWSSLGTMRLPIPLWGVFNPSKVLPEILGPIVGSIAAYCIYPVTRNYVYSITLVQAVVVSGFIVVMVHLFARLVSKKIKLSPINTAISEVSFFISFFILFKKINMSSYSGFWATNYNCYFHYIIPGLLNAIMVFIIMMVKSVSFKDTKYSDWQIGVFLAGIYFALFSSPQLNIILASYCIIELIITTFKMLRRNGFHIRQIKSYFSKILIYLVILVGWIVSIVFDLHGQRSAGVTSINSESTGQAFMNTFKAFGTLLGLQNFKIVFIFMALVILASVAMWRDSQYSGNVNTAITLTIKSIISGGISFVYLVIAYAKAGSGYAGRIDAMWAVIFYFLLTVGICFSYLLVRFKAVRILSVLMITIEILITINFDYLPVPANVGKYDATTAMNVDNHIISQIVRADKAGESSVTVTVPWGMGKVNPSNQSSNWPHSYYMAKWLQNALYSHRLIRSRLQITIKPDKRLNKSLYPDDQQQPFTPLEVR